MFSKGKQRAAKLNKACRVNHAYESEFQELTVF